MCTDIGFLLVSMYFGDDALRQALQGYSVAFFAVFHEDVMNAYSMDGKSQRDNGG